MVILAVGAHPDDIEFAAFGTLAACAARGDKVVVCSVTNGNLGHNHIERQQLRIKRMAEAAMAAKTIGATYSTLDINDTYLDSTDTETRNRMTEIIRSIHPDMIITHASNDYHDDHIETNRLVHYCAMRASLPQANKDAKAIDTPIAIYYMDKIIGTGFIPTEFVDITDTFEKKMESIACHVSQCEFLMEHNGIDIMQTIEVVARYRGLQCGLKYAEAFRPSDRLPLPYRRLLP